MENSVFRGDISEVDSKAHDVIGELAEASYACYVALKNDVDFLPYLEQMGTLPYYGMTNIGSRPVGPPPESSRILPTLFERTHS